MNTSFFLRNRGSEKGRVTEEDYEVRAGGTKGNCSRLLLIDQPHDFVEGTA